MRHGPDPVPALKAQLAAKIVDLLDGWSNSWAAWTAHLSTSRISELRNGRFDNVSLDRLVRCLAHLDHTVEMTITRNPQWGPPAGSEGGKVCPGEQRSRDWDGQ